jgi:hypothetical protein
MYRFLLVETCRLEGLEHGNSCGLGTFQIFFRKEKPKSISYYRPDTFLSPSTVAVVVSSSLPAVIYIPIRACSHQFSLPEPAKGVT